MTSPTPTPERKCMCGNPYNGEGVVHRTDGPCYVLTPESRLREELVKQMADRFLGWKLPTDFSPDGGVSFDKGATPIGTNLLTATQAEEMVRHMLNGVDLLSQERERLVGEILTAIRGMKIPDYNKDEAHNLGFEVAKQNAEWIVEDLLKSKN